MTANPLDRIILTAHRLTRQTSAGMASTVPNAHWRTLAILESDGPIRVGELAAASGISQPGMTRTLGELDEAGYIERVADHADARARMVAATPAGREALAEWRRRITAALAPRFADLDDAEREVLARAAEILERGANAERPAAEHRKAEQ